MGSDAQKAKSLDKVAPPPIVVLAFNRPQYLGSVLRSLARQTVDVSKRPVFLFQDGAVNAYSKIRYARDEDIAASIAVFESHFPDGEVIASSNNIGVAENFSRAERHVFETYRYECAYFFEDDLILSKHYIETMDNIWRQVRTIDEIAYFSAYGDHLTRESPSSYALGAQVKTLQHHWAFGLKRSHWLEMQPLIRPYLDLITGKDYRSRDWYSVFSWFDSLGFASSATSQDSVKSMVTNLLNRWRINTVSCLGRYIGEQGLHFTPEQFKSMGFGDARMLPYAIETLELPSKESIRELILKDRENFAELNRRNKGYLQFMNKPADEADIRNAYLYIFGREPDSEAAVSTRIGMPIHKIRRMFLESREFRNAWPAAFAK